MSFVITGVLESLERDEAAELIQKYGGRSTSTVSKKTSFVIVGDEPGASKLKKAEQFKIPELTEDGLLDLIRKSNKERKHKSPKVEEESEYFSKRKKNDTSPPKAKKLKFDEPKTTVKEKIAIPESNFYSGTLDSGVGSSLNSDTELTDKSGNSSQSLYFSN